MPKIETRDTREAILTVALKLFSERGYDGVGIRDIAKEIGIRESALYKHFSSKQAIFDSILEDVERRYRQEVSACGPARDVEELLAGETDPREELFRTSVTMFQFYLTTAYGSQLRRMLIMEQFRTSQAGRFFHELIIERGLAHISGVFAELIRAGVYADADPMVMALQFYSPLYLLLSQYDGQPEQYEEALTLLKRHIAMFNTSHSKGDEQ